MVKDDSMTKMLYLPVDNFPLSSGSVTTTKCQGCLFAAEGAYFPASSILLRISSGTGSFL